MPPTFLFNCNNGPSKNALNREMSLQILSRYKKLLNSASTSASFSPLFFLFLLLLRASFNIKSRRELPSSFNNSHPVAGSGRYSTNLLAELSPQYFFELLTVHSTGAANLHRSPLTHKSLHWPWPDGVAQRRSLVKGRHVWHRHI